MEPLMTWRMSVVHKTSYVYESDVVASFNELRMTPVSNSHQMLVRHRTTIDPSVALLTYRDYWGTMVEAFDLHTAHLSLDVVSDNVVETSLPNHGELLESWLPLQESRTLDKFSEYLCHTPLTPVLFEATEVVASVTSESDPHAGVNKCIELVRQKMTYTPGATHVFTPASEAWSNGRGVCQDYSHITLSLLRSAGIPARYVSGYHYTGDGEIGQTVVGESHAWLEAWVGEWIPVDPTNGRAVGEQHVVVAYGRDYTDVSPMRGIFSGGQSREINVSVSMTRQMR